MGFEDPTGGKVVDMDAIRRQREERQGEPSGLSEQAEGQDSEGGVDFVVVFGEYGKQFSQLNQEFEKILDDSEVPAESKVIVRRQIAMNKFEMARLLHVTGYYQSYEDYEKKIDRILEIFRIAPGEARQRANRSLQNMETQLSEFAQVFKDYELKEEQDKVAVLRSKILQGFTKG